MNLALERVDPPFELIETAELLLQLVRTLLERARLLEQALRPWDLTDSSDHFLAAVGELAQQVLWCLGHVCVPPFVVRLSE